MQLRIVSRSESLAQVHTPTAALATVAMSEAGFRVPR